jgi:hypothetical protein
VRGQRHAPAAFYPRERPGTHCTGGWVGPRAVLDRCRKSRPNRDSIPGPSSPWPVAIPTELPSPFSYIRDFKFCNLVFNGSRYSGQRLKLPGTDVEHSTQSTDEVTNEWCCTSTIPIRLCVLDRHNFPFLINDVHIPDQQQRKVGQFVNNIFCRVYPCVVHHIQN